MDVKRGSCAFLSAPCVIPFSLSVDELHHTCLTLANLSTFLQCRCADCGVDSVEDNDFAAGIEHVDGREPIEFPFCTSEYSFLPYRSGVNIEAYLSKCFIFVAHNKNGDVVCKKHNATKDACFAFKKQIVKLNKE